MLRSQQNVGDTMQAGATCIRVRIQFICIFVSTLAAHTMPWKDMPLQAKQRGTIAFLMQYMLSMPQQL